MNILPVILSGGSGTRLWPLSRQTRPKQLLPLVDQDSLLQKTIRRLEELDNCLPPLVICNDDHRFLVAEQLREINVVPKDIILEPVGRNTAPAVTIAALFALRHHCDPILLVLPADHLIKDEKQFVNLVKNATKYAAQNKLITFGIVPTAPETGYGYIKAGEKLDIEVAIVDKFVEKPDKITAESYLAAGNYFWNSGMFMFRAAKYLQEIQKHRVDIFEACLETYQALVHGEDFSRLNQELFAKCPSDSIDYAVMEKTADAIVVPMNAGWSDIGSWSALAEISNADAAGNFISGDVLTHKVKNCYLRAHNRLLAAVGLENIVVVDTDDAILVVNKNNSQDIKEIVDNLKNKKRQEI